MKKKSIYLACFSPTITIIPLNSSLSSPLKFLRSRKFYLTSNISLRCDQSLSTIIKWKVYQCQPNCSIEFNLGNTIITDSSEIVIPSRTLPYGYYKFQLKVSMSIDLKLTATAGAYIQISRSGITANLVRFGTSFITTGTQQDIFLNPAEFSSDLDENLFNVTVEFLYSVLIC